MKGLVAQIQIETHFGYHYGLYTSGQSVESYCFRNNTGTEVCISFFYFFNFFFSQWNINDLMVQLSIPLKMLHVLTYLWGFFTFTINPILNETPLVLPYIYIDAH